MKSYIITLKYGTFRAEVWFEYRRGELDTDDDGDKLWEAAVKDLDGEIESVESEINGNPSIFFDKAASFFEERGFVRIAK